MVSYSASDLINIADFAYAWRITDARWDKLPTHVLERLRAFSDQRNTEICKLATAFPLVETPQVPTEYRMRRRTSLEETSEEDGKRIKEWLVGLPIPLTEWVYVCWRNSTAIAVEWGVFVQIWDSLWYPFDDVCVFDETLEWAVLFGREERAVYIDR